MKFSRTQKGQSLVEFALIIPLLMMIALGIIEFGRVLVMFSEVTNASREAARYGATAGIGPGGSVHYLDCNGMRKAARDRTTLAALADSDITISYDRDNGSNGMDVFADCGQGGLTPASIILGDRVVVTVTTTIDPILAIVPLPSFHISVPTARTILKDVAIGNVECQDGIDNDGDGKADFPDDDGCINADDTTEAICYRLEVLTVPPQAGSVSFVPVANCANLLIEGTVVDIDAYPNLETDLYTFDFWSGDASGTIPSTSVTIVSDMSVTANFRRWQADLAIDKTDSPDPVFVGERLDYTLSVTNGGPDLATGVRVTDTLPAGVTNISATPSQGSCGESGGVVLCDLGEIDAGAGATVIISVDAPMVSGSINNVAEVAGSAREVDTDTSNNVADEETLVNPLVDLYVTKSASPHPEVYAADKLTYLLPFRNNGPSTATGVTVVDTLPAGVTFESASWLTGTCSYTIDVSGSTGGTVSCAIGELVSGASGTVTIVVWAPDDAPDDGTPLGNQATISGVETDKDPANNDSDSVNVTVTPWSDLAVRKSDSPDPAYRDDFVIYTIEVTNNGPSLARDVQIKDLLPDGVTFESASWSKGASSTFDCGEDYLPVICHVGDLASGETATATIRVVPTQKGSLENRAWWESVYVLDLDSTNDEDYESTVVEAAANLTLAKKDLKDPVKLGENLVYELTIQNHGPSIATGVRVVDKLPDNVRFVSAGIPRGSCSPNGDREIICDIGTLDKSETIVVTITVEPTAPGTLQNTAVVSANESDPSTGNNEDSEDTTVEGIIVVPSISVTLNCDGSGDEITVNGTDFGDGPFPLTILFYYGNSASDSNVEIFSKTEYTTTNGSWSEIVTIPTDPPPADGSHLISVSDGNVILYADLTLPCIAQPAGR